MVPHHLCNEWLDVLELVALHQSLIPRVQVAAAKPGVQLRNCLLKADDLLCLRQDLIGDGGSSRFKDVIDPGDLLIQLLGLVESLPDVCALLLKPSHLRVLLVQLVLNALDSVPMPLDEFILESLGETGRFYMNTLCLG